MQLYRRFLCACVRVLLFVKKLERERERDTSDEF